MASNTPITIDDLRSTEFSKAYNWSISLEGYSGFFPCHIVSEQALAFTPSQITFGNRNFDVPGMSIVGESLSLSVYETRDWAFLEFLVAWKDHVQPAGTFYTKLIGQPGVAKAVTIAKLRGDNSVARLTRYLAIPSSNVEIQHTSDKQGTPVSIDLSLIIVGTA